MTAPDRTPVSAADRRAVAELAVRGIHVADIQDLARDQRPFAQRITEPHRRTLAAGVVLDSRTLELESGSFTNAYTLTVDLNRAGAQPVTDRSGFRLRGLVHGAVVAAVSGSFSYISDDPAYQPDEPCLDLTIRHGQIAGLPTTGKPALLLHNGRLQIHHLPAIGTLTLAGHPYRWAGSKDPRPGHLAVFGAANCRVRYRDDPRTGFLRDVDPATNTTPHRADALDATVGPTASGLRITALHPGGGADLFTGALILRALLPTARHLTLGAPVRITSLDTNDTAGLEAGFSLGPTVAAAARGDTTPWDASLGLSPFRPGARYARTLIALDADRLHLQVLDGAPLTDHFRGVTAAETARLCEAAGWDPEKVYHLDGGQTSKIAYRSPDARPDAVGSLHYLRWPANATQPFHWQGLDGRVLRSALTITASDQEAP
ncbi:phosphodiester glycosidase family protein [Peterkaempfera bronchialis]|uniref:Phosphodiester glycosidase domain-containing protein n=1 Tax=Peterkaempfera bronchialis TaxID=2126346 RepID=A0A345STB5_9ACTN|nr:phosphodiester glycosidase family protein [Peterkaempfera bronchialis]AXI76970.1 hypothetical protein C7M71_005390 [Peterkaempfera bronchialis]